ncbi:FKBP-type peptidyl-prolyl cis-trans isomerase [Ferruginibacter yonginensis]|uniref:Peptidyl-prolyl cis-trans isomerase n=1 Tax=Ferruginibacter yonginensis TaxID=1310416 RepID=A0ABV8QMX5_9BACT
MKKSGLVILVLAVMFSSCIKKTDNSCNTAAPTAVATAQETAYLQNYITTNNITNAVLVNGMYYAITTQGTGTSPNICSTLAVRYTGNLINGTTDGAQFDASTSTVNLNLSQLIIGWQLVMPQLKSGGTITLYIPPSLGYGSQPRTNSAGAVVIPANSYLKFVVNLDNVQ